MLDINSSPTDATIHACLEPAAISVDMPGEVLCPGGGSEGYWWLDGGGCVFLEEVWGVGCEKVGESFREKEHIFGVGGGMVRLGGEVFPLNSVICRCMGG